MRIVILAVLAAMILVPLLLAAMKPLWTKIQVGILNTFFPGKPDDGTGYERGPTLTTLLGDDFFQRIEGKTVIDFGCGEGLDAVEMAKRGAKRVIGIDIREEVLRPARAKALASGVEDRCLFTSSTAELADMVLSVDAFEHYGDPAEILEIMSKLLKPGGEVVVSFGWPWYHPLGGHLFSVFPWAHLIFSEKALCIWRSGFKTDGATRFHEGAGGLNQMTIRRFERLVAASPLQVTRLELVPIKKLRPFHNRLTREFTTALIRCRLTRP